MSAVAARDVFLLYRSPHGDVPALRGLNLHVDAGQSVAVLGPSGAGKSSLLRICAGFERPSSGDLLVLGTPIATAPSRRIARLRLQSIGIVRQHYHRALPRELTAEEIAGLPLRLQGRWGRDERTWIGRLLRTAGLASRAGARPHELSGGEQQRLAVCAAVAKRPRLLLADEPTGELDPAASQTVIDLLLELSAAADSAALIVSHDLALAARTDRTIHIRDGRLTGEGIENPVLVVDAQGWVRLPQRLRETAGIGEHARAAAEWGRLELIAVDPAEEPRADRTAEPAPAAPTGAEVEVARLHKAYGARVVLADLSRGFASGRLHVVAGPSGSGKTTLLNLIAGLERADAGEVRVGERRIDELDAESLARWRAASVGYVSQHSTLVEFLSARENVELALTIVGVDARTAAERATASLERVGLGTLGSRSAGALSGGEQRRVAVARALARAPALLIADEPTAQLDRTSARRVIALLREAATRTGTTVIAASHDPDVVAAADEVLDLSAMTLRPR
jgi:ABC-type lipoprotein export system ATPase subunit